MTPAETTEAIQRVARLEERERILGIIEYYITTLEDSTAEKNTKHILEHVIRTIEHN